MSAKNRVKVISASAGSGKTHKLMELVRGEVKNQLKASELVAVTYTKKAAEELKQRIREELIDSGEVDAARRMASARIGTVHSVCAELLKRFSFEDGSSPRQRILEETETQRLFDDALNESLSREALEELTRLSIRFETPVIDLIKEIRVIASLIRQNHLGPDSITGSVKASLERIALVTEPSQKGSARGSLQAALDAFVRRHPSAPWTVQKAVDAHEEVLSAAQGFTELSWASWVRLSKLDPGVKAKDAFNEVLEAAKGFIHDQELKDDLASMIRLSFEAATKANRHFSGMKRSLGVLDYGDLEEKMLELLDDDSVREQLSSELKVLFVDEFQDTNPIQLAIFLKLSALCERTVWVGDIKQSIYRFRGADPGLMKSILDSMGEDKIEVLGSNWRSAPAVVEIVNTLFSDAFRQDGIAPDQVVQKPEWKHALPAEPLEVWSIKGGNKNERANRVAVGIAQTLAKGQRVIDRDSSIERPVRPGDMAVLCRSNDECKLLAAGLDELGIANSVVGGKLGKLPEVELALSAYRFLINPDDKVAAASLALVLGVDRNTWLESARTAQPAETWHPALERISKARAMIAELSVPEKLDLAISVASIESAIEKMPSGDARLFHLSALRQEVRTYEESCRASYTPCTDSGFLQYLDDAEPEVPATHHPDAVTISTYHKSKGLEWPLVVLASLEKEPREDGLFGIRAGMAEGCVFDPAIPLANRRVTFLPWAFGKQKKIDSVDAVMARSPLLARFDHEECAELRRLLYVGLTRARETLVLIDNLGKHGVAKSALRVLSDESGCLLEFQPVENVVRIGKTRFTAKFREVPAVLPENDRIEVARRKGARVLPDPTPRVGEGRPLYLQPSHLTQAHAPAMKTGVSIGRTLKWGSRLILKRLTEKDQDQRERSDYVGSAVHLFLGSDDLQAEASRRKLHAEKILKRWSLFETLDPAELVAASDRFSSAIRELWPEGRIHREIPMEMELDGSIVRGAMDALVVTGHEIAIIDHKTSIKGSDEIPALAGQYALQLAAYAKAAALIHPERKVSTWIHNPDG